MKKIWARSRTTCLAKSNNNMVWLVDKLTVLLLTYRKSKDKLSPLAVGMPLNDIST